MHLGAPVTDPFKLVEYMDKLVGLPAVSCAEGVDNPIRRQYYGQPGEFRVPKANERIEYRTLSNFWLGHTGTYYLFFELLRMANKLYQLQVALPWVGTHEAVVDAIQRTDHEAARKILAANERLFFNLLRLRWTKPASLAAWRVLTKGAVNTLRGFGDIEGQWLNAKDQYPLTWGHAHVQVM